MKGQVSFESFFQPDSTMIKCYLFLKYETNISALHIKNKILKMSHSVSLRKIHKPELILISPWLFQIPPGISIMHLNKIGSDPVMCIMMLDLYLASFGYYQFTTQGEAVTSTHKEENQQTQK